MIDSLCNGNVTSGRVLRQYKVDGVLVYLLAQEPLHSNKPLLVIVLIYAGISFSFCEFLIRSKYPVFSIDLIQVNESDFRAIQNPPTEKDAASSSESRVKRQTVSLALFGLPSGQTI